MKQQHKTKKTRKAVIGESKGAQVRNAPINDG